MDKNDEIKNQEYLNSLLKPEQNKEKKIPIKKSETLVNDTFLPPTLDYSAVDIRVLPASKFYKPGTKIMIRPAKVGEIQAYSVVDNNNLLDVTEKMNELLSRNILFIHPDGKSGTYRDIKDADRVFLLFMIREMTFAGGQTLTKEVQCDHCMHEFSIPFRATAGQGGPATFELKECDESIDRFWNEEERCYEIVSKSGVSYKFGAPTIGIQEDFYDELKREAQNNKKPNVSFMKIVPFMLYDRNTITPEGIKAKLKEFSNLEDIKLFNAFNKIIDNMTFGIKGFVMKCGECGAEVHTEFTFPNGASAIFEIENVLDDF